VDAQALIFDICENVLSFAVYVATASIMVQQMQGINVA
jgi:hypothetical protein